MRYFIFFQILFSSISFSTNLAGQPFSYKDSIHTKGMYFFNKGEDFFSINLDSSIYYYDLAIPYMKKAKNWEKFVDCFNSIAEAHFFKGTFADCEVFILRAEKEANKYLKDTNPVFLTITGNLGVYYSTKGFDKKALSYYQKKLLHEKRHDSRAVTFGNIGMSYKRKGDFKLAILNFNKGINLYRDSIDEPMWNIGITINNLAALYIEKKNYHLSRKHLHEALNLYEHFNPNDEVIFVNKITTLNYLAETLLYLNFPDSSLLYLNQALKLHEKPNSQYHFVTYSKLGKAFQHLNRISEARQAYQRAIIEVLKQHDEFNKYEVIARHYITYAEFEADVGNYEEALAQYQIALIRLSMGFENTDIYSNPKAEKIISNPEGLRTLIGKAKSFYRKYLNSKKIEDIKVVLSTYKIAHQVIQSTRKDILNQGSKHQLAEEVLPIYEGAIQAALELYKLTQDKSYLRKAFLFAESNKAILLLESLNETVAKNYGGIPDSLLELEEEMRIEIAFYEKRINQEKAKTDNGDQEKIKNWEERLFNFRQKYNSLISVLEKEYPRYYELKYQSKITSIQDIQEQLIGSNDAFLEYFIGDKQIYLFQITKEDFQVFETLKDTLFLQAIQKFLSALNHPHRDEFGVQNFIETSSLIYQKYLASALKALNKNIERLIIIPDDALGYIPFEALITTTYTNVTELTNQPNTFSPNQQSYLFEDYTISYAYSGTLLQEGLKFQTNSKNKTFLGIAPSFGRPIAEANRNCSSDELYSLNCSSKEVNSIGDLLQGKVLTGIQADKAQFLEQAKDYRILHLATHSCADSENHMLNKIFFADDFISNYDLFNMQLNAELAVLSSCNTGSGELIKGEGVMSLSKGFFHSGCPSTLISLWSVDDCATSDIMIQYYNFLKKGQDKDEALRSAKLVYLNSVDKAHQHPYYWAAFVQMGNFAPIDLGSRWNWWWSVALSLGIVGIFGIWFFKNKSA